jgi:uncharacterized protein (DUF302 family)
MVSADAREAAMAVAGLITRPSRFDPDETMGRLERAVTAKGMTIFARIDHAAGAKNVGLELRPTALLIFGNARGGTPPMQTAQTLGIDLPLKALVWQDEGGKTWLSVNDPAWLAERHGAGAASAVAAMTAALQSVIEAAVG